MIRNDDHAENSETWQWRHRRRATFTLILRHCRIQVHRVFRQRIVIGQPVGAKNLSLPPLIPSHAVDADGTIKTTAAIPEYEWQGSIVGKGTFRHTHSIV
jgi:hypothetical protein